jgi:hypothetical protein
VLPRKAKPTKGGSIVGSVPKFFQGQRGFMSSEVDFARALLPECHYFGGKKNSIDQRGIL